ncbi:MAG: 4Fe-4S binding protein [Firmicutes bacterium]|nr:4Fe-4S binding protein [Bacillota bacterium]
MVESKEIGLDSAKCVQCGACTGVCPCGALTLKRPEMTVRFRPECCIGCELCMQVCPTRAIGAESR